MQKPSHLEAPTPSRNGPGEMMKPHFLSYLAEMIRSLFRNWSRGLKRSSDLQESTPIDTLSSIKTITEPRK